MIELSAKVWRQPAESGGRERSMIDFLRRRVLSQPHDTERFHAVFLDERRSLLGDAPMGQGCKGSLSVRMRELFGAALDLRASAIIVAHNHPSGMCRPSEFDSEATARLKHVAEALDIELLDHLIFTRESVYSMRAGGML